MNSAINKKWLRKHGVEGDDATLEDVVRHAEAALEMMVGYAIAKELTDEHLEEFEQPMDNDASESERSRWLGAHCPQYEQIVERVREDFKKDVANSEHPITFILERKT